MSVAFASARPRGKGEVTQQTIQKMLDENHHLIQCIMDYQSKGKTAECTQYQQILHRNLVYLATIADSNQNMQSLLPAPPTQNINLGPGGMTQSASNQSLHSQSNLSDAIGTGLPPSSLMQSQISNGPNHVSMQQSGQNTMPTTSLSMTVSSHGTGPGYSHTVPASQNVPMQGQGSIGNYVSRTNINMQSNPVSMMHQQAATSHYNSAQGGSQHYQGQSSIAMMSQSNQGNSMMGQRPMGPYRASQQGSSQQYMGQEEYYSEQYSHGQGSSEPMNQQYYPDGHGDYAYQQSSYTEQSYDRSFDDSTQHYYEGGRKIHWQYFTASSRQGTNRELHNSKRTPSSNTQISKVTRDNSKDTVLHKEPLHSIPATNRDRGSNTEVTELLRQARPLSNRGLTATSRDNMEIISNKRIRSRVRFISIVSPSFELDTRYFVDHRKVRVVGGQGGGGGHSFYSEPRKIFGGPDGGNGGDGGHVILKADRQMKSLSSILPFYQGFHGEKGGSKNCYGANGAYMYVKPPVPRRQYQVPNHMLGGFKEVLREPIFLHLLMKSAKKVQL
ncbi:hypothetical protein llap_11644 [Limosa lapponica baueri]|uniref:Obg domain-containing protein n=1 Tax=Limosa lapponica baueri TaxID=1758121 RepID=A0A2I0TW66_LIMLA|nr:hypothetical protein llap_11644 [Limosa lapponica baueri]